MTGGVSSNSLTLTIRLSSSARFEIGSCGTITPNSTIQQVKQIISQREESGNCAVERQRLIFKGRILSENTRTLADYGISSEDVSSGIVLYLVKGGAASGSGGGNAGASTTSSAPSPAAAPTQPNPNASAASNPFLNFGQQSDNSNPMASMMNMMGSGGGGGGMPDLASFQQQLQQNPQMMSDMMNNPMVQSLLNSPDFMSSMMENNPQMRSVMESNPELRNALQDPEFMRRSMEMMRDPSAMQNAMRNQDLAMSQIENMPGGYSALRRMYEDVQEPMMDAMAGGTEGSGPGTSGGTANPANGTAGATNQAMPNPWGAPAPAPAANTGIPGGAGASANSNPFASMMASMGNMNAGAPPTAGAGAAANPWANPAMGSNVPNIESTIQMMENPMMQQMMQNMMSDPNAMQTMMNSNPMLQQLQQTNPQMAAMINNPETMRSMMEPNNLRAMLQMQQSMQQLGGVPGMPPMPGGMFPGGASGGAGSSVPPAAGGLDFSSLLGGSASGGSGASPAAPMANPFMFPFMPPAGQQQPAAGGAGQGQQAPGERFRHQLQNLNDMGFTDRSANIRALASAHGNVSTAIEILLESPPEMGGGSSSEPAPAAAPAGDSAGDAAAPDEAAESSDPKGNVEKKND